jgi:hypothetical protein
MSENLFFFDLTRHRGPARSLISSARAFALTYPSAAVEWFVSPLQRVEVSSLEGTIHQVTEYDVCAFLEGRLHQLNGDGVTGNTVHVFSHSGYVLSRAAALRSPGWTIRTDSFKTLSRSNHLGSSFTIDTAGKMSVEEAVELTKKILTEEGHVSADTALLECYLRPRLVKRDRRATKRSGDLASVTLITEIVEHGLKHGWLNRARVGGRSGTERIWFSQQSPSGPAVAAPALITSASIRTSETTTTSEATAIGVVVPVQALPASVPRAVPAPPANKGKARTQEMISILNNAFVYSPNNIRRYVFSAISGIRNEGTAGKNWTVAQFMKEVKDRAMAEAQKASVPYKHWKATMDAILEMLLAAKAMIGPGEKAITRGLHARGTQLVSIIDNFEDACELFLLKVLIQKMQLTSKDRVSIAHALFKEGSTKDYDKLEERLDALFVLLGNELSEAQDGTIVLESQLSTGPATSPRVN